MPASCERTRYIVWKEQIPGCAGSRCSGTRDSHVELSVVSVLMLADASLGQHG